MQRGAARAQTRRPAGQEEEAERREQARRSRLAHGRALHAPQRNALEAYDRRIAPRIGGDRAVFATARELTTLIYRLLRRDQPYVKEGAEAHENR